VAASTSKKIVIRRFEREPVPGFVNPQTFLRAEGIELLSLSGAILVVPYADVKAACFVRDFDAAEPSPEHRVFNTRTQTPLILGRVLKTRCSGEGSAASGCGCASGTGS